MTVTLQNSGFQPEVATPRGVMKHLERLQPDLLCTQPYYVCFSTF